MPKVSVIIPVYGVERYIERCARSLFEQTLDDIEYLFIDDCTPDKSVDILMQVLGDYPARKEQVVIHRMEKNSGQAAVRSWGMKNAKGNYIIHCDSDDWVDLDMYRVMYEQAVADDADLVVCDYCITDDEKILEERSCSEASNGRELIENFLYHKDVWALWNKLFRKSTYEGHNMIYPTGSMGEDMAMVFQMAWNCKKITQIKRKLYYYYYNQNSITKTYTVESCLNKYYQLKSNVDIVVNFISDKQLSKKLINQLAIFKNDVRNTIIWLVGRKEYYDLWRSTYPDITLTLLLNRRFPLEQKLKFVLTYLGLYPRTRNRIF